MSLFRYPGGKTKLFNIILQKLKERIKNNNIIEYREPFLGGGSICQYFLKANPLWDKIWINDIDIGIACLWTSILNYPDQLKQKVNDFVPNVSIFHDFKRELLLNKTFPVSSKDVIEYGFKKFVVHQLSYSGLGVKAGPLGGDRQDSKYKIDCRWYPKNICSKIGRTHLMMSCFDVRYNKCSCLDFESMIIDEDCRAIIYLDPPYYVKGNELYQYSFSVEDHQRLSNLLKHTSHKWVLSYDDCPFIKELYSWANLEFIDVTYSINRSKEKKLNKAPNKKAELIITND